MAVGFRAEHSQAVEDHLEWISQVVFLECAGMAMLGVIVVPTGWALVAETQP